MLKSLVSVVIALGFIIALVCPAYASITSASWQAVSDGARVEISHSGGVGNSIEQYHFEARTFDGQTFIANRLSTEHSVLAESNLEFTRWPASIGYVSALEKIGMGQVASDECFFGAIGASLEGTEALLGSQSSILGQDMSYYVTAIGKGTLQVGLEEWHNKLEEGEGEEEELTQSRTGIHLTFQDYEFEGEFHVSSPVEAELETWSSICQSVTGWEMESTDWSLDIPVE